MVDHDLSGGQFLAVRSAATPILLDPFTLARWRSRFHWGTASRSPVPADGARHDRVALFFWAIVYLPLADAITFYLAGPIYVTALISPEHGHPRQRKDGKPRKHKRAWRIPNHDVLPGG